MQSSPGPATKGTNTNPQQASTRTLRHPTACPTHPTPPHSFPRRSSTHHRTRSNMPNSQRSTHEQPASDIRRRTGLQTQTPTPQRGRNPRQTLLRKEVIQPHLPVRLPCYDFVPIASPTFDSSLPQGVGPPASGVTDFRDVTGGVYKARERIHRSVADLRLLATPTSWGRVADPNPN